MKVERDIVTPWKLRIRMNDRAEKVRGWRVPAFVHVVKMIRVNVLHYFNYRRYLRLVSL